MVDGLSWAHVVCLPAKHVVKDYLLDLAIQTIIPDAEGYFRRQVALQGAVRRRRNAELPVVYKWDVKELILNLEDQVEAGKHVID